MPQNAPKAASRGALVPLSRLATVGRTWRACARPRALLLAMRWIVEPYIDAVQRARTNPRCMRLKPITHDNAPRLGYVGNMQTLEVHLPQELLTAAELDTASLSAETARLLALELLREEKLSLG